MRRWMAMVLFGFMTALGAGPAAATGSVYDVAFRTIDGAPLPFDSFKGRPVLVVNTASFCGFTPQYEGLQAIWEQYREQGLVVLGVPSRDFNQEYTDEGKVKEFCEVNFSIDFPLTEITRVKGADAHPFFAWAAPQAGAPSWNFNKYLVGPDGGLIARYSHLTGPRSGKLTKAVETALRQTTAQGRWTLDGVN